MNLRLTDMLVHAAIVGALAAYSVAAQSAPVTFKICGDDPTVRPTFKAPPGSDSLEVRCPGDTTPALTIKGCVEPKVRRVGDEYTLTCTRWNQYTMVPKPR